MTGSQSIVELSASPEAIALTREAFVVDGVSLSYVLDPPYGEQLLAAGVNATNVSVLKVGTEGQTWEGSLEQLETGLNKIAKSPDLMVATSKADFDAARLAGKLAVIVGSQGSYSLGDQPRRLRILHRLGLRVAGLAYTGATMFGDGCGERRDAG